MNETWFHLSFIFNVHIFVLFYLSVLVLPTMSFSKFFIMLNLCRIDCAYIFMSIWFCWVESIIWTLWCFASNHTHYPLTLLDNTWNLNYYTAITSSISNFNVKERILKEPIYRFMLCRASRLSFVIGEKCGRKAR